MTDPDDTAGGRNRTVFRPSPLAGLKPARPGQPDQPAPAAPQWPAPPQVAPSQQWAQPQQPPAAAPPVQPQQPGQPPPAFDPPTQAQPYHQAQDQAQYQAQSQPQYQAPPPRLDDDDIPMPAAAREVRSLLVGEAAPILALTASVRSGRARIAMPDFHRRTSEAIARYERAIAAAYPEEIRQRAKYVLCATIDDVAQNLPNIGHDGAEWARRSLVVQFFRENIGGDRFWQLVDDVLARPAQNAELIELFHACLAAGFEGRFRVMPDGKGRLQEIMARLYGALEHPRSLSMLEIAPQWKGTDAPMRKVGTLSKVALAAAAALLLLLIIYALLRLVLMTSGEDSWKGVRQLSPESPLRLSRLGAPPPRVAESNQVSRLRTFLEPEIRQKLVTVTEDASTVRVRTTVGQLFQSGSDQLETGRAQLFDRIGRAVEAEKGEVTIEGHADSDKVASLSFPDNLALSKARAEAVGAIIRGVLSNSARVTVKGFGDSRPIASNKTADGKSRNRRVEIVVPRLR